MSLRFYPRIRERLVSVREIRIGMFDFLQLSDENPDGVWLGFEKAIDGDNRSWQEFIDACGYEVVPP